MTWDHEKCHGPKWKSRCHRQTVCFVQLDKL